MKKYLFYVVIFLFSVLSFSAGKKESAQILATPSKEPGYMLTVTTTSGMSGVMIKWIKPDSLKTGKVKVLFENEKGDSEEIQGEFSTYNSTKTLSFSPVGGTGETAKKFIKSSKEITLIIQDKKGSKSEKIIFDVAKISEDWR